MIDSRSSKSHIDINLVPTDCLQTLSQPIFAEQMDGIRLKYDRCVRDAQISFYTIENDFSEYYPLPQVWASPINHKFKFILRLNFIRRRKGSMLVNSNYVSLFKRTVVNLTDFCFSHIPQHQHIQSELHAECGGINSSFFFDFSQSFDDLEIENSIDEVSEVLGTSEENLDNYLQYLDLARINNDKENSYDLGFILKKIWK